jgi:NAD(P)-dependent dehydrogenase (short-subunit alcohol dehydrogenase family)
MAPGYLLTEISSVDQSEYPGRRVDPTAVERYGMPAELGPVAIFLASEASSFTTGSVVTVDGGCTLF